jgi:hypothetical protein
VGRPDVPGPSTDFSVTDGLRWIETKNSATWAISQNAPSRLCQGEEIAELLTEMTKRPGPGHYYVDISSTADTLVLSRSEYT